MNNKLIDTLKNETNSLKVQFIDFTKEYVTNEFNTICNMTYDQINEKWGYFDFKWNRYCQSKKSLAIWGKRELMRHQGLDKTISIAVTNAEQHYEDSIIKLALRIESKGLNIESLKCTTSHVGRNINTTLTDGIKTVRAFTIIAEGEIQKPHYRYLVK